MSLDYICWHQGFGDLGLGLVNLSLPCNAIVMSGMSGYLDGLNFDSDEDFEETAGRASTRQADRQDEARVPGHIYMKRAQYSNFVCSITITCPDFASCLNK